MRAICLWAVVTVLALRCHGAAPVWIRVDNQTYDTVYLSRIGDPGTSVLVPKRMTGQFEVPLVGQGSPALETLLVSFPGNISVPETEFRGFNGQYAQAANLVIASAQNISIAYEQKGSSPATNRPTPAVNSAGSGGYYGGGYHGGNDIDYSIYRTGNASPSRPENSAKALNPPKTLEPPKKRVILPDNAGAKVKVVAADSRYKLLEAPIPIRGQLKETPKTAAPANIIPPPAENKKGWGALIIWIVVCIALVGSVAWKRMSSK